MPFKIRFYHILTLSICKLQLNTIVTSLVVTNKRLTSLRCLCQERTRHQSTEHCRNVEASKPKPVVIIWRNGNTITIHFMTLLLRFVSKEAKATLASASSITHYGAVSGRVHLKLECTMTISAVFPKAALARLTKLLKYFPEVSVLHWVPPDSLLPYVRIGARQMVMNDVLFARVHFEFIHHELI